MRLATLALITAVTLSGTAAFAQSPGNGAGATAGGSSASGGDAASSTTTGNSMNGSTTGNNGPSEGLSPANDPNLGPPSNAAGNTWGMGRGPWIVPEPGPRGEAVER
jgi:hypothetical protein